MATQTYYCVKIEHIERVLRNGRHLLRLVNDAIDVSRYEAGEMKLQIVPTSIRFLVDSVVEMLQPLVRDKQIEIVVNCDRTPDQVFTDSLRLQQVITNLVSNALRYTEKGLVQITCESHGSDKWVLIVSDTGIGISPEDRELIFNPYYRVSNDRQNYVPDSTGLGLAIVTQLVQLLKGKIELSSEVGVGSTFTVSFPVTI